MIGRALAHYEIVRMLGKGGMGEVFVAEDMKLQRKVALKVLPQEMAADPDRRARFQREARAVAALNHPNIVTLHSFEEADGVHFITMELIEGETLGELTPRKGFTPNRWLELAIPLADAVSRAHREGITHRDLKPDNIMVDNDSWDLYPDWSPDGGRMIFVSDREEGLFKIFIANSDGGGERLLVDQPITVDSQYAPVIGGLVTLWSPGGEMIAFIAEGEENRALWTVGADGNGARMVRDGVTGFDWYRDSRHGIYARHHGAESEMVAIDLETGREQSLFVGPFIEMDVAPDGSAVAFSYGRGHMAMGLAVLKLEPPREPGGLPRVVGEPEFVVSTEGTWHVHNGGWSADSKQLVYTRGMDYGDIFELVERP